MKLIRRILQLYENTGLSYRQTGDALNIPYTTVADYIRRYKTSGLTIADLDGCSDREIYQTLFKDIATTVTTTSKPLPEGVSVILCKRSFSVIVNHPVFKENSKMIHSFFPVLNGHGPLFTGVFQC